MGDTQVQWSSGGLHFSWKLIGALLLIVLPVFGLGTMVSPRLAVIDADTLQAITLAVKDDGRKDDTFVGGGGVARAEFNALAQLVGRNTEGIEKLLVVTTENSQLMVRLLEPSLSSRSP